MKIYTKTGDQGQTSLWGGKRVGKDHLRIEGYGSIDELASYLGVIAANPNLPASGFLSRQQFFILQTDLMTAASDLATPLTAPAKLRKVRLAGAKVIALEQQIDEMTKQLPRLNQFILPGGELVAAQLHFARTICRRAERRVAALASQEEINPIVLKYLNRLSDWLFTAARLRNLEQQTPEQTWGA